MSSGIVTLSLDATTKKLEAFLGGAGTPPFIVIYHTVPASQSADTSEYRRGETDGALAGAAETTILAAPPQNSIYHIDAIYINNDTGGTVTVTVVIDNNGTNRILVEQQLLDTETLNYTAIDGFRVL